MRKSKLDAEQNKLIWLTPAPANNTDHRRASGCGRENKLTSLADLSRYLKEGGTFKLAASAEFIERADALPAFEKPMALSSVRISCCHWPVVTRR